jgi:hypothetical protein
VIVPSRFGLTFSASIVAASRTSRRALRGQWVDGDQVAAAERSGANDRA